MSNVATDPVVVDDKAAINAVNTNTSSNGNEVRAYDFGGNPLFHSHTGDSARLPAFGGEFQPGLYKSVAERKFANPAPLGLSAFALTTFVLSLINLQTRGVTAPNFIICLAFGYGGLVQLLAGMWYVNPFLYSIFKIHHSYNSSSFSESERAGAYKPDAIPSGTRITHLTRSPFP